MDERLDGGGAAPRPGAQRPRATNLVRLTLRLDPSGVGCVQLLVGGRSRPIQRLDGDALVLWLHLGDEVGESGVTATELLTVAGRAALLAFLTDSPAPVEVALWPGMPRFAIPPGTVREVDARLWTGRSR